MIEVFNTAGCARDDSEYRHAAGEIMSEAGVYLHPIELSWFISARGTDDEALEAIRHRKAYITRAASLIPALLSFFDVKDSGSLESVLRQIDDFCRDFPAIKATPHEKRVRKEIASGLQRVLRAVTDLSCGSMSSDTISTLSSITTRQPLLGRPKSIALGTRLSHFGPI
ncbi:MAG: hypothetical protein EOQ39_11860 [Mesorhizobium sp.]|uniref:hypothetical protein n=1 Tax=Mesorhizobium sp. TaxID=1871066 RepID=UPI000FE52F49|nr:hypothetical protein [Mesorhizobium sp.]RWB07884.1 MAG: hypothetical protein EOQ37_07505 [Mesorhizobium sp.]RWB15747.1 MAG: hypothetical protein EOQ39_11860 [Mesorhizobium sp.]